MLTGSHVTRRMEIPGRVRQDQVAARRKSLSHRGHDPGRVALRQSTDPGGPALILEPNEIRAFVTGAKAGLADDLLT
jgi:hypothetical protein